MTFIVCVSSVISQLSFDFCQKILVFIFVNHNPPFQNPFNIETKVDDRGVG